MNHEFVDIPDYLGGNCGWCQTLGMCHNTLKYVPVEKYFYCDKNDKNYHPEFYNVINGKPRDLCFTNGITDDGKLDESMEISVVKCIIEEMKKDILENPDKKYFCIEQEDGVDVVDKEVGILEKSKHTKPCKYREPQHDLGTKATAEAVDQKTVDIVGYDRRDHEQRVNGLAVEIEKQAGDQKDNVLAPIERDDKIDQQHCREEIVKKRNT
jgi:hypothetical protein